MSVFKQIASLFSSDKNGDAESDADDSPENRPQAMRLRLAEFENARVEDVMIPRADIVALDSAIGFEDLIGAFAEATHSRLPVYRETLDDPIGFVHIKDVVAELARMNAADDKEPRGVRQIARNILFVPPSMKLTDLLVKMQATRIHMAMVIDEYGGTDGLVSLEDLVEEIVGDIEDEHDTAIPLFTSKSRGIWEVDARMEISDFEEETEVDLSLPDYEDEIDTLGGVAFALAGRVPERGEVLHHPSGMDIEIMDADGRRIKRLKLRIDSKTSQEAAE